MHTYWLAIMAVCLAAALAIWIALVFMADRKSSEEPQDNLPHREIVGGTFEARRGGRQVMPDPNESAVHEPDQPVGRPSGPPEPAQAPDATVPPQRTQPASQRPAASQERRT